MKKKLPPPCDTCPCAGWGMECEAVRKPAEPAAADHPTAAAVATRIREWIAGEPVTARSEFGNGYREALRDITDLLGPAAEEPTR